MINQGPTDTRWRIIEESLTLFLVNGGYHTVQFTVIGLVLGLLS